MSNVLVAALFLTPVAHALALARGGVDPFTNGTLEVASTACRVDEQEAWAPLRNILNHMQGKISSISVVPPITPPPDCAFKILREQGQILSGEVVTRCYLEWGLPAELSSCWGDVLAAEMYTCNEQCTVDFTWDKCSQCKRPYTWEKFRCRSDLLQMSLTCQKCHSEAYTFYLENCDHMCEGFFDYDTQLQRGIVTTKECTECNDQFWEMERNCFGDMDP